MKVRQAANVVTLLEYFAARGEPATLAEIADDLGWPRSSTFNIVGTLVEVGYFYEPRSRGGYYPSPRWLSMAQEIAESDPIPDVIRQLADKVSAETGETTAIGSMSGQSVVFIHVCQSRQPIRYNAEIGTTVPLHASSAGRSILAQMEQQERDAFYRKLNFEKFSDTTPMSIDRIESDLREAEARGYHQSDSEYIADLAGVALPLAYGSRRLSIVVAGPVSRCLTRRPQTAQAIRRIIADFGMKVWPAPHPT
ncbi:IclR family transcriptional regulator [Albibacillus kandeliae]|uniref:IclR family transcriptional regulator n=1 Tax=Albibacillus kandeliae TaxID=2174228 RepID=UPI000D69AE84|nr:IclR family transcriptional regulator [Albibacillus kandeliae]